jgi:long-subunit fatty acid transport protein
MRRVAVHTTRLAVLSLSLASSRSALAAGFDTPILYTARHQGMGGTAIASVDDASAGFHNPAGLQGVQGLALIGDFSLILGKIRASPTPTDNLESKTVVAPFFLLGAAYRIHPWVTLGLAGFPVASGGAEFRYSVGRLNPATWLDKTDIVFFEVTPMLSLNVPRDRFVPGKLAFGAGYRFDYVTFGRERGEPEKLQYLNLHMKGTSFTGVRLGLQYQPIDALKLGVVFRNKVVVTTRADSAKVLSADATDAELDFTLPAKLGFGLRGDVGRLGLGTDVEWAFQSQNRRPPLSGTLMGTAAQVPNVFDWQNGVTLRLGAEYRVGADQRFPLRVGYIFDSRVGNPAYPTAFGTPPAATRTFTAGAGYVREHWQVNLAVSRRFGSTRVTEAGLGAGCAFCGYAGDYSLGMTGLYVDASVDLPK